MKRFKVEWPGRVIVNSSTEGVLVALTKKAPAAMSVRSQITRLLAKPFAVVVLALVVLSFVPGGANAALYYDPGTPAISTSGLSFSVNQPYLKAILSDDANTDIGSQDLANVTSALESLAWFGTTLSGGAGGLCGAYPTYSNGCTQQDLGGGPSNKEGFSNLTGNVFGVHFGNNFIAFLFAAPISDFHISGLRYGVSNIFAFDAVVTPVPAAAWLFGSGLALLGFVGRRKTRSKPTV